MSANFQGLSKRVNKKIEYLNLHEKAQEFVINTVRDVVLELLKTEALQNWIAGRVSACAQALGIDLTLTNIQDKDATRADFDAAVTAKINQLAGTAFTSIAGLNREAVKTEVGRVLGERLGLGPLYPVDKFRAAMGQNLVQSFDGTATVQLFGAGTLQAVEDKVLKHLTPLSAEAIAFGNPMHLAGPPVDAKQAAKRADNRRRQAKYRRTHALRWVPLGGPD